MALGARFLRNDNTGPKCFLRTGELSSRLKGPASKPRAGVRIAMDDSEAARYERQLGRAASAMAKSARYCQYPIACLTLWISPAILHEQIHFFIDDQGGVAGYMTWAVVERDTEYRLLNDPQVLLHISEWNEGDRLWILDFLVVYGEVRTYIREAAALFEEFCEAKSVRRSEDGKVRKVTTWKLRSIVASSGKKSGVSRAEYPGSTTGANTCSSRSPLIG